MITGIHDQPMIDSHYSDDLFRDCSRDIPLTTRSLSIESYGEPQIVFSNDCNQIEEEDERLFPFCSSVPSVDSTSLSQHEETTRLGFEASLKAVNAVQSSTSFHISNSDRVLFPTVRKDLSEIEHTEISNRPQNDQSSDNQNFETNCNRPTLCLNSNGFGLGRSDQITDIVTAFKNTAHANYFSFLQYFMIYYNSISVIEFLNINDSLLRNACFQRHNYWLRIAPEIVSFLHYTVDYLSGNCPSSFYHHTFSEPLLYKEERLNDTIEWQSNSSSTYHSRDQSKATGKNCSTSESDSTTSGSCKDTVPKRSSSVRNSSGLLDDSTLLIWTDIWWACRYKQYNPRIWRSKLSPKIVQCSRMAAQAQRKRRRQKEKLAANTAKVDSARNDFRKVKASLSNVTDSPDVLLTHGYKGFQESEVEASENPTADLDPSVYFVDYVSQTSRESDGLPTEQELNKESGIIETTGAMGLYPCLSPFLPKNDKLFGAVLEAELASTFFSQEDGSDDHYIFTGLSWLHEQEQKRFANPDIAFTYKLLNGTEVTVDKLYRCTLSYDSLVSEFAERDDFLQQLINQSAHFVHNVYIIDLVRDAAARLQNRRGSRVDIVRLLLQSHYINIRFALENDSLVNGLVGRCLEELAGYQNSCIDLIVDNNGTGCWVYTETDSGAIKQNSSVLSSSLLLPSSKDECYDSVPVSLNSKMSGYLNNYKNGTTEVLSKNNSRDLAYKMGSRSERVAPTASAESRLLGLLNDHCFSPHEFTSEPKQSCTSRDNPLSSVHLVQTTVPQSIFCVSVPKRGRPPGGRGDRIEANRCKFNSTGNTFRWNKEQPMSTF